MSQIKAVLSDIGNVIMEIRTDYFLEKLADMARTELEVVMDVMQKTLAVDDDVNRGSKTMGQVFDEFVAVSLNVEKTEFIDLWRTRLGDDFPQVRRAYENLKVPLYILSNTNDVHAGCLHGMWFEKLSVSCWLSNEIGMTKPNREIYEYALSEINCNPEELLFFDDLVENVESSRTIGINAILVTEPDDVVKTLNAYNLLC